MLTPTSRSYSSACQLACSFGVAALFAFSSYDATAQGNSDHQGKSIDQLIYENDNLFQQLSGAARTRLEHKQANGNGNGHGNGHGRKVHGWKPPAKPAPLDDDFMGTDGDFADGLWARNVSPFSALPNPLVNDPTTDTTDQDTQSETTLILAGGSNVVCGFNDSAKYDGFTSFKFTGFSQSTDGGVSWTDRGSLPTNPDGDAGDPTMAYSKKTGAIIFGTLSLNNSEKLLVFRSTDNGATFQLPVNAAPGFTTNAFMDKEWLVIDNFPGNGFGNAYLFWRNFGTPSGMTLTKSTDDGLTWGPSGGTMVNANAGQGAQVVVGTDHSVYCFWYDQSGTPSKILMRKSTDFGVTFGATITVTTLVGTGSNGDLNLGGYRSSSFPQVVVNPVSGNIYVVYADLTAAGDHGNIFFRQSSNGGTTWTAAVRVNDDITTTAQYSPGIAVKPDGSALALSWYDRRRDPGDTLIERWAVTATISGSTVTFGPNFRIGPQFAPVYGVDPVVNPTYMGDYDQMAADTNYFYTTWGDNRDQSIGDPSRKNANVRFARFTAAGIGPSLDADSVIVSGGNGNGLVDPNECNDVSVVIRNYGSTIATNISATVTSTTPGVIIGQAISTYPDAAPGAAVTNVIAFKFSTTSNFVCGTAINLNVALNYGGGPSTAIASVPVGGLGYILSQSSGASIVPGTVDTGNHDDDTNSFISLPFPFVFYGTTYSNASLSSNGALEFGTSSSQFLNSCLPTTTFTDVILPFWDDLMTIGTGDGIFTSISGTAPNRIFNIEWRAIYYSSGLSLNFEVRLYENGGRIDFIYGNLNGTGSSATVGIQHGATFTSFECNAGGLSQGLQLAFQRSACVDGGGSCVLVTTAGFTANPTSGLTPLTTYFTNFSFGGTNYLWNFGDSFTSTATNPAHIYTNAGNFDVSLRAIGPAGTNTFTRTNYIQVVAPIPPFITSQPVSQSSVAGSPVTFTVNAGGTPPLSYQWQHQGTNLPGATTTILSFPVPAQTDVGNYLANVISPYGSTNSITVTLAIVPLAGVGDNSFGQINTPAEAADAIAVAAGSWHSLAIRSNGAVVAWGNNGSGQCDVPASLKKAAAVAGGGSHTLAITPDRKVVAWGDNFYGQSTPPANLSGVIAIAAGSWHSLALKSDGTVIGWGDDNSGQTDIPPGLSGVIAIAAGGNHSLALRSDGTVFAWGENTDSQGFYVGQSVVPPGLSAAAIAAGDYHNFAVNASDGSITGWGDNSAGQVSPPDALVNVIVAAAGGSHSLALKNDATVVAWGNNGSGQCNISPLLQNVVAVAAGEAHSLILLGTPPLYPQPLYAAHSGNEFSVVVQTIAGKNYALEYKNSLTAPNWTALPAILGNGSLQFLLDTTATGPARLYRIKQF